MDIGVRKNYKVTMLVEYDVGIYMYEDSESPEIEVGYRLDEGFQTFLKDNAHSFDPESIKVLSVEEIKKK